MSALPSVMVVDDEQELAYLFMEMLKGSGYDCVSFTDPLQALEYFIQNCNKFMLVITDLRMPGIDGIHLAQKITDYNPETKVLLVTAFNSKENFSSDDLKKAHISKVMQKPVKMTQLRDCVNELYKKATYQ